PPDVDAHLAVRGAVPAADALPAVRGDAEPAPEALEDAEDRRHRTAEPAPDAAAEDRVEADADDAGEDRADVQAVRFRERARPLAEPRSGAGRVDPQDRGRGDDEHEHAVDREALDPPRAQRLVRVLTEGVPERL